MNRFPPPFEPQSDPKREALFWALLVFLLLGVLWLAGCSSLDREYQAGYNFSTGQTSAGVLITPGTGRRSLSANVTGDIDWRQANRDLPKFYRDK